MTILASERPPALSSRSPIAPKGTGKRGTGRGRGLAGLAVVTAVVVTMLLGSGLLAVRLFHPFTTTVVDRTPPPVLVALKDLSLYKAAAGEYEVLIDNERDVKYLPSWVAGERVLFIGVGGVDASVDFRGLGEQSITTSADRRSVTIVLPHAALGPATVDYDKSHVASRSRGIVNRVSSVFTSSPTDDSPLYKAAAAKMNDAAAGGDLAARAEQNTANMLTHLLNGVGYTDVTVRFEGSAPVGPVAVTDVSPAP